MESLPEIAGNAIEQLPERPQPTPQDRENDRVRRAIADRMAEQYGEVLGWALGAFGPGWLPSHKHFLLSKEEEERSRQTGERARAAATVYTVKDAEADARHFTVSADGKVVEVAGYEEGFGPMLTEPHPTAGFWHGGAFCRVHRYSLCWAPIELYHPKSAEQLAALRASRGRKKEERADRQWAEENPLLAWAGLRREAE